MIEFDRVTLRFGSHTVLKDFSSTIDPAHSLLLWGASGAGKTTLLRLMLGLEKPDAGAIRGLEQLRFSVVFQEDRLLPWLTALENVLLVSQDETRAKETLAKLGLYEAMHEKPRSLSGGMRRRVSIARALCYEADVLLLDEPFTGLDESIKRSAAVCIRESGKSCVIVTHDESEAALLGVTHTLLIPSAS